MRQKLNIINNTMNSRPELQNKINLILITIRLFNSDASNLKVNESNFQVSQNTSAEHHN